VLETIVQSSAFQGQLLAQAHEPQKDGPDVRCTAVGNDYIVQIRAVENVPIETAEQH